MKTTFKRFGGKPKTSTKEFPRLMELKDQEIIILALEWLGFGNIKGVVMSCPHANIKYYENKITIFRKPELVDFNGNITTEN